MLNTTTLSTPRESYLDRNSAWLMPAFGTLVLTTTPALVDMLGIALPIPSWLPVASAVLGSFLTGFRSMFVDTISARIVRFVGNGLGIGIIVAAIFH